MVENNLMNTGNKVLISILIVMSIISIGHMPQNFKNIEFIFNELQQKEIIELDYIKPHILILKTITDVLKILTLIAGFLFAFK